MALIKKHPFRHNTLLFLPLYILNAQQLCAALSPAITLIVSIVERNGSRVELWAPDYDNPGSNPVFHSTLLPLTQLYK